MAEDPMLEVSAKLEILVKLVAAAIGQGKPLRESIILLAHCGLDRKVIADVLGTTPMTVSVRLSEAKKKSKRRSQ